MTAAYSQPKIAGIEREVLDEKGGAMSRMQNKTAWGLVVALTLLTLLSNGATPVFAATQSAAFSHTNLVRLCATTFPTSGVPTVCSTENTTAGAPADTTIEFTIPFGHYYFGQTVTFTPPQGVVTAGAGLPPGAIIGRLRTAPIL
jgi:hypothetical protein